jgi:predicted DNA-binding transcriptional regulator AlpA
VSSPEDRDSFRAQDALSTPTNDSLINIADVRRLFGLGRTAAYELTHRPGFPDPVIVSTRCYRWWASEVDEFAATLRREGPKRNTRQRTTPPTAGSTTPRRIDGKVRPARISKKEAS